MVAERRARNRPLIGAIALTATEAWPRASAGVMGNLHDGLTYNLQDYSTGPLDVPQPPTVQMREPDRMAYLHQLVTLHRFGVLTDEEFLAAKQRLLGA
jgi:hypothetical protein